MKHYAGLDVSVKETSICIVDETGKIYRKLKIPSHPEDLLRVLQDPAWNLAKVGLEAGPLSQWLFSRLTEAGLPVVCIETRHGVPLDERGGCHSLMRQPDFPRR